MTCQRADRAAESKRASAGLGTWHDAHLVCWRGARAGKTTAVGMLIGLLRPTAGSATVVGHDVQRSAPAARRHIGYCPQQNVLFGGLTVWEHLLLFGAIKGLPGGAFGAPAVAAAAHIMQVPCCLASHC